MNRRRLLAGLYIALLTAFTCWVALDTFVIPRAYSPAQSAETAAPSPSAGGMELSAGSYYGGDISITLMEYRAYDSTIYAAEVLLSDPTLLKTALAQDTYGRNITETTSRIAAACGAILAVNGDFYGARSSGYVLRNGVLYRETASPGQEDLVIWQDGSFEIVTEGEVSAVQLAEAGAWQVLSFGPALLKDGAIAITEDQEVGKAKASNPRTAIGILEPCHYLFVVSDGRTANSAGLSLYQLAEFMQGLGASVAYNLDGGGSSTLVFNGALINNPTSGGNTIQERRVSDIVYLG